MPPVVLAIEIARPPDEVFSYVTDPHGSPNGRRTPRADASWKTDRPAWANTSPRPAA